MKSCCLPTCYVSSTVIKENLRMKVKRITSVTIHDVDEKEYGEILLGDGEEKKK